jgi:hypothetical protein
MSWLSRKPKQQNYLEAAIKVASNLYLRTIPGTEDAPTALQLSLPDSRYRYLLFCLSAAITAALVYDEKKEIHTEALIKGCLDFAAWAATETPQQYFGDQANVQESISRAAAYVQDLLGDWSRWPELEKAGMSEEIWGLICTMIHTTESSEPINQADKQRLGKLALQIDCQLPAMRAAFVELAGR